MPNPDRVTLSSFWHDLPREGKLLLSVVVFEFIGTGLVLPFHVVYLHEVRGFSLATVGVLLSVQAVAGLAVLGPGGHLIDRIGARRMMIGICLLLMAGEATLAFATTLPVAVLGMVLTGAAFGVSFPSSQAMIAAVVPSEIRSRYFGTNFALLNLGIGLGGLLGGAYVDVHRASTFTTIYLVDAISFLPGLFLLLVPLRHVAGRVEHPADEPAVSYLSLLRRPAVLPLTVLTLLGALVAYSQLNIGLPAYSRAISKVSTQGLGIAFAANTLVIVLLQLVVLRFIEQRRRTRVIAVMGLIWALAWSLMALSGLVPGTVGATVLVAACASVFALGETLLQPTVPAIVNDLAPDHLRGRYNALNAGAFQISFVLAPPVTGFLIGHGLSAVYVALLLGGCVVLSLLSVWLLEPALPQSANR